MSDKKSDVYVFTGIDTNKDGTPDVFIGGPLKPLTADQLGGGGCLVLLLGLILAGYWLYSYVQEKQDARAKREQQIREQQVTEFVVAVRPKMEERFKELSKRKGWNNAGVAIAYVNGSWVGYASGTHPASGEFILDYHSDWRNPCYTATLIGIDRDGQRYKYVEYELGGGKPRVLQGTTYPDAEMRSQELLSLVNEAINSVREEEKTKQKKDENAEKSGKVDSGHTSRSWASVVGWIVVIAIVGFAWWNRYFVLGGLVLLTWLAIPGRWYLLVVHLGVLCWVLYRIKSPDGNTEGKTT